jgi:hypothetical protein
VAGATGKRFASREPPLRYVASVAAVAARELLSPPFRSHHHRKREAGWVGGGGRRGEDDERRRGEGKRGKREREGGARVCLAECVCTRALVSERDTGPGRVQGSPEDDGDDSPVEVAQARAVATMRTRFFRRINVYKYKLEKIPRQWYAALPSF